MPRRAPDTCAKSPWRDEASAASLALLGEDGAPADLNSAALIAALQEAMARDVGPFRTARGLERALGEIARLKAALGANPPAPQGAFDTNRLDWFDLRNMLLVAEAVAQAALRRSESRGAHQREDFPAMDDVWARNQSIGFRDGRLVFDEMRAKAEAAQ